MEYSQYNHEQQNKKTTIYTIDGNDTNIIVEEKSGPYTVHHIDSEVRKEIDISNIPFFEVKKVNDWKYETSYEFPAIERQKASVWDFGEDADHINVIASNDAFIQVIVNIYRQWGEIPAVENVIENKITKIIEITTW